MDFGQNERIIRLKLGQLNGLPGLRLIKRYLVFWLVAWSVQWRSSVTRYALYTSPPPGKEEEGTALPPDEPNRPCPVGSLA